MQWYDYSFDSGIINKRERWLNWGKLHVLKFYTILNRESSQPPILPFNVHYVSRDKLYRWLLANTYIHDPYSTQSCSIAP